MSAGQVVALCVGAGLLALLVGMYAGFVIREFGAKFAAGLFGVTVVVLLVLFVASVLLAYGTSGEWFS